MSKQDFEPSKRAHIIEDYMTKLSQQSPRPEHNAPNEEGVCPNTDTTESYINRKNKPLHITIKIVLVTVVIPTMIQFVVSKSQLQDNYIFYYDKVFALFAIGMLLSWWALSLYDNLVLRRSYILENQVVKNEQDIKELRLELSNVKSYLYATTEYPHRKPFLEDNPTEDDADCE